MIMNKQLLLPFKQIIIVVFLFQLSSICEAQQLIWRYEYDTGKTNMPGHFWIDESGNGYFNIGKENPASKNTFPLHHSLLILNGNGEYNGSVFIKQCKRGGNLLPYNDDKYIMSGQNCEGYSLSERRSYLFNHDGTLAQEGRSFDGSYFAQTPTKRGYTYFSKPSRRFSHTYLSIGYIDEDFNISNDSIPLGPLKKEGLGMVFNFIAPVQLENESWIMPFNYGKVRTGISVDHGSVFCVKDEQILWQYPKSLSNYRLTNIDSENNNVTLLMRGTNNFKGRSFVKLNSEGKVLEIASFLPKVTSIKDMKVYNDEILILGSTILTWYDWNGELIREFDLSKEKISGRRMQVLEDGSVVVVGMHHGKTVILKVSIHETNDKEINDESLETDYSIISAQANFENEKAMSVSVFPNPSSIRINFEIKSQKENQKYRIDLFDRSGRLIFSDNFESTHYEIALHDFVEGTYFYRIFSQSEEKPEIINGQFVKIN